VDILLRNGGREVYLTDERMTRFWLSLEDSFKLVLFALENMEGGEIFIPKEVPSMPVKSLFEILAPGVKRKVIGMRPGEKVHEILLTEEESRHSLELKEYYVVIPETKEIGHRRFKKYFKAGKRLPKDFFFSSDKNKFQISKKDMTKIIESLKKKIS
jgi:UDP-N-acetylglucosamine 4,6-dehydratase